MFLLLDSSEDDDMFETYSFIDSECNLSSEEQAESSTNPLNAANDASEIEAKELELKTSKAQRGANRIAKGEGESRPRENTGK